MENQQIKTLRKELGLSQRQFAKKLGVSHTIVRFWESGKKSPSNDCKVKLAELVPIIRDGNPKAETKSGNPRSGNPEMETPEVETLSGNPEVETPEVETLSGNQESGNPENGNQEVETLSGNPESGNQEVETLSGNPESGNQEADHQESQSNTDDTSEEAPPDEPTEGERRKNSGKRIRSPFVQSVLDQIPIEGEIGKDVQLRRSSKKFVGLCPFHNDTHPSFEVYPHTQSWFCYGCQKGGSLIDYVMYRDSVTPAEAIHRLCETYNIPQPSWTEKQKAEWEQTKQEKELIAEINLAVFKWYHDQMLPERLQYYQERGIVDATIDKQLFGYASLNDAIVGEMLKHYKAEQLVASGLFTVVSGCLEPIYKRRYVMPYWEDGKIVYSIGRLDTDDPNEIAQLPEWNRGKYKKQLVHSDKHPKVSKVVQNVIWNADCVGDYDTGSIAEGIIDGTLHKQISDEIGLPVRGTQTGVGVISPVTTKFSSNDIEQLVNVTSQWEKVYCISDNEVSSAGIKGAVQTAKTLFKAGRNPHIVLPPRPDDVEKVDLADYLNVPSDQKEARTTEFSQLLSSSPPLLDYLITEAKDIEDKKKRNEKITEIISLMVDINPLELEEYKDTLEEELGVKRGVFKSIFEQAKKEKEEKEIKRKRNSTKERSTLNRRVLSPQITMLHNLRMMTKSVATGM